MTIPLPIASSAAAAHPVCETLPATDARRRSAHPWTVDAVTALFDLPFNDLLFRAQAVHREHFDANAVQLSTLLSIKTGGCEEDCKYCPQSAHFDTGVKAWRRPVRPRTAAPPASAWVRPGARPKTGTLNRSAR